MKTLTSIAALLVISVLAVLFLGQGLSLHEALRSVGLPPGALPIIGLCMIAIANTRKQGQSL
ncbi:MAG: hypothetical protein AAF542_00465 [Pseudomonadota bacterium]